MPTNGCCLFVGMSGCTIVLGRYIYEKPRDTCWSEREDACWGDRNRIPVRMIYLHPTWHPSLAVQLACTLWLIKTCLLLIHFPNSNNFKDLLAKIIPILISLKKACFFQGAVNGILSGAIELRWNFFRKKHHFLCLTFDWQASQQISVERDLSMRGKDRGVFPALWQRPTYSFCKS